MYGFAAVGSRSPGLRRQLHAASSTVASPTTPFYENSPVAANPLDATADASERYPEARVGGSRLRAMTPRLARTSVGDDDRGI